jgi:chitosanase
MPSICGLEGGRGSVPRLRPVPGSRSLANRRFHTPGAAMAGLAALIVTMSLPSCRSSSGRDPDAAQNPVAVPAAAAGGLTAEQKLRADRLINMFEQGTSKFLYGSAEALDDGRGITFGRAGFTTESGDGYELVKRYVAANPDTPLARYLPRLEELAHQGSGKTEGLTGFIDAIRRAADDPRFCRAQDELQDKLYYRPSAILADSLGLKTALARTVVYDSLLMHGEGDDPDGLPALLARTRTEVGGTPATGADESAWLSAFLRVRRADLAHSQNADTRAVWAKSVGRADVFRTLADQGNWDLHGPIVLKGEYAGTIP